MKPIINVVVSLIDDIMMSEMEQVTKSSICTTEH